MARQIDEHEAHQDGRGVHRQAGKRGLRDEGRVIVDRQENVGRARRHRQCRDQRADRRTRPLGDDRGRDHERGRDRHAQRERDEEGEIGGHRTGRALPRPACGERVG